MANKVIIKGNTKLLFEVSSGSTAAVRTLDKAFRHVVKSSKSYNPRVSREHAIAEAAYHRAEKRGFASGDYMSDWLDAETMVDQKLMRKPKKDADKK